MRYPANKYSTKAALLLQITTLLFYSTATFFYSENFFQYIFSVNYKYKYLSLQSSYAP